MFVIAVVVVIIFWAFLHRELGKPRHGAKPKHAHDAVALSTIPARDILGPHTWVNWKCQDSSCGAKWTEKIEGSWTKDELNA